ncbi:enoyl-CoA hydratase/isomerase family protein [Sphingopyxis sp.]|uniref:enoyl-CoA hydratase/isomerase family protein n=1 Tax=Sphingopyxis sp. TaxID=1908224 RepID=UPI003D0FBB13
MTEARVLRDDSAGLATLTLNRPEKLNALDTALFRELGAHVAAIAKQTDSVGCVLVRGAGRAFSAGHDLGAIGAGESDEEHNLQATVIEQLANLPQPVISAVHGHCYTGALELALAGDIILAAQGARFADTHAKWGLTPIWGMSQRLPRRVGATRARDLMFTCRTVSGAEAERIGLADHCFDDASFDTDVATFAKSILANSWFSNAANKRLLIETDGLPLAAGLAHEVFRSAGTAPDAAARIASFAKRKA